MQEAWADTCVPITDVNNPEIMRAEEPWPNRAETAVRLFKRAWVHMAKALANEGCMHRVIVRQAVKKVVWPGIAPSQAALLWRLMLRPALLNSCPHPSEEGRTMLYLHRVALTAHQEAREPMDIRNDLARRMMHPHSSGDKGFAWIKKG